MSNETNRHKRKRVLLDAPVNQTPSVRADLVVKHLGVEGWRYGSLSTNSVAKIQDYKEARGSTVK